MATSEFLVNQSIKGITRLLCRVDDSQLARVPQKGPLILVANHINFIEVPLIYTHLRPRPVTGFAKAETWDNPLMGVLFNMWKAIPLRRGEADIKAMHQAMKILQSDGIVAVAPEGTRSGNGCLQRGYPGVVLLAELSDVPLLPIAYYGNERFRENIRRLRRTDFHIAVGHPFRIQKAIPKRSRQERQLITDEIMYQLAVLLPPAYRGYYSDLDAATDDHLVFDPPNVNAIRVARSATS